MNPLSSPSRPSGRPGLRFRPARQGVGLSRVGRGLLHRRLREFLAALLDGPDYGPDHLVAVPPQTADHNATCGVRATNGVADSMPPKNDPLVWMPPAAGGQRQAPSPDHAARARSAKRTQAGPPARGWACWRAGSTASSFGTIARSPYLVTYAIASAVATIGDRFSRDRPRGSPGSAGT